MIGAAQEGIGQVMCSATVSQDVLLKGLVLVPMGQKDFNQALLSIFVYESYKYIYVCLCVCILYILSRYKVK